MSRPPSYLEHDWYSGGIPGNVTVGADVFIDTSYAFAPFMSQQDPALTLGDASGVYDRTTFVVGPHGRVTVGAYTCLNALYVICNDRVAIGAHCLLAWGVVIADTWLTPDVSLEARRQILRAAAQHPHRWLAPASPPRPVVVKDNVWVGFDAVISPGVVLGRGCIVGAKSVVIEDAPPYTVIAGNPAHVVRALEQDDTEQARQQALREYLRG